MKNLIAKAAVSTAAFLLLACSANSDLSSVDEGIAPKSAVFELPQVEREPLPFMADEDFALVGPNGRITIDASPDDVKAAFGRPTHGSWTLWEKSWSTFNWTAWFQLQGEVGDDVFLARDLRTMSADICLPNGLCPDQPVSRITELLGETNPVSRSASEAVYPFDIVTWTYRTALFESCWLEVLSRDNETIYAIGLACQP